MNTLKRYFVMPFMVGLMIAAVHSLWMLITQGFSYAWFGVLVAVTPMLSLFLLLMARPRARTSRYLPVQITGGVTGTILVLLEPAALPLFYALGLGLIGTLLYVFWFSNLGGRDTSKLIPGAELPEFTLKTPDGGLISSRDLKGHKTLLMFYRANWCPLCMAQIGEVAAQYRELQQRGVKVGLVSSQPQEKTLELAARFDVPMNFYTDPGNEAARLLGIAHEGGTPLGMRGYDPETTMPTVVITDEQGKILFADLTDNYRVRPEPGTFLKVLDEAAV